ncbi:hypothetical protein [Aquimarina sp. 2201CG5-10]|uniref:hypothetical protein n=1 Tax=Aquimarina callyspongiae TaxID=3098150 RepID=UPI002AB3D9D9|nr:hypothetical protein [Aquimarina sp. 2201CG5-10]MDY8134345.1 hypothetical protein [Aquimarina sp. 2201CG5-10]
MTFRKIISLSIAISFIVLCITGVLSFFNTYSRVVALLHTIFGILFTIGVLFHFKNNFRSIKTYSKGKLIVFVFTAISLFFLGAYYQAKPFEYIMNYGARLKANSEQELNLSEYEIIEMNTVNNVHLTIDLLRSEHYWHPQMAIWIEDSTGNYQETLFVSKATARGLFFGGRNKENYKSFDEEKETSGDYRRVNALPVWSHKRDVKYEDGLYVPTNKNPLPDAITGATITDNFKLKTSIAKISNFRLKIELNVAFDDNEYYSEFDFPEDEVYHSGTGQLGQPSIIFDAQIDMNDGKNYYLMELIGHGHHSGQTGEIFKDLSTLTTAKKIVERIVIGVHKN